MLTVFLKTLGWTSLITIIGVSILFLSVIDVMLLRAVYGVAMVVALTVSVGVPFWIAYGLEGRGNLVEPNHLE